MIMACLAAITIVIKAERNDGGGSPKGMAVIVVKRMKQYFVWGRSNMKGVTALYFG